MILLLSCDGDLTIDIVIDWLQFYKVNYIRINSWDILYNNLHIELTNANTELLINDKRIEIKDINVVWLRKFGFFETSDFFKNMSRNLNYEMLKHINTEFNRIISIIFHIFKDKKWITNYRKLNLNKFEVLKYAQECGLLIPQSHIINTKEYINKNSDIIIKSIYDPIITEYNDNKCMMYTNEITEQDLKEIPNTFFPSLIQEKIRKKYEVRIFYLNGKCYSMAIFSQNDTQTQLDFRRYNWVKPNRYIPYNLPKNEEKKIILLMKRLDLNCGSIDLIKSVDNNYYFLEVNPTGQFGMVDFPCNYGLHKKVAEQLIKMDN
jgi:ATP-GRASP peptide maturase of grasp-with-spasm system